MIALIENILLYSQYQKKRDFSLDYTSLTLIWLTPFYWRERSNMWRVACCRTCLDFFGSDLIEAREQHFTGLSLRMFFRQISMSQCLSRHWRAIRVQQQIWNRTRPRARVQNQQTGELIINSSTLMEFMYLVFTRMPGESYRGRLRFLLLYLC